MPVIIHQTQSRAWRGDALTRLIQLTRNLLTPLEKTAGVQCGFVLDNRGTILGSFIDTSINPSQLNEVGRYLAQIAGIFELHQARPKELECRFAKSNLYIRDLGNALAAVVYSPNVTVSLLRMEINVAASPFEKDMELQAQLKKAAPSTMDTLTPDYLSTELLRWLGQIRQA